MVWDGDPIIIHGMTDGMIRGTTAAGMVGAVPGITADGITIRGTTVMVVGTAGIAPGTTPVGTIPGITAMEDIGVAVVTIMDIMTDITTDIIVA